MDPLKFLQWNARSIQNKKHEIIHLSNTLSPTIICITETWLKPDHRFSLQGYSSYRDDRLDGHGGSMILVNNKFTCTYLTIPAHNGNDINIVGIKIKDINILSIYLPHPNPSILPFLRCVFLLFPPPLLVLGDFNSHNSMWGSETNDSFGSELGVMLEELGLCILNDGRPTRMTPPGQRKSCVDLTICSNDLATLLQWNVLDSTFGSDHYPIITFYPLRCYPQHPPPPLLKYRLSDANWENYKKLLENKVQSLPQITAENLNACYKEFCKAVSDSADLNIPLKNSASGKIASPPWWDRECTEMIKSRKKAEKDYKQNMTDSNLINYQRIAAKTRRVFRRKKTSSWRQFCASLSPDTSSSIVWNQINRFRRGLSHRNSPSISEIVAGNIFDKIAPPFVPNLIDLPYSDHTFLISTHAIDHPFTMFELLSVLSSVKDSAPGVDGFPYSFLIKAGKIVLKYFLNLINAFFDFNYIPKEWKTQIIIPILKHGKPPEVSDSYRPIALSSTFSKIFEHLLKNRLEWFVEKNSLLPSSQFGFRKGLCTVDSLGIFVTDLRIAFSRNESVLAAFLDITAAYDNVILSVLRYKLQQLSIPEKIIRVLCSILMCREVLLRVPGQNLGTRLVWKGLPQGCVLSPILYNLYTSSLHLSLNPDCQILQYADDLVLYISSPSISQASSSLQISLDSLSLWLEERGLQLSASKSTVVTFSRKRNIPLVSLKIEGSYIPVCDSVKFLGLILDSKLTGIKHIEHIIKKAERNLNIIKALSGVSWGSHPFTQKILYHAIVRSVLDYGTFLLKPSNKSSLKALDTLQSRALRCVLGCMRSTPVNALQVECVDPPLFIRFQFLSDRFLLRVNARSDHPLKKKLECLDNLCLTSSYWHHKQTPPLINSFKKLRDVEQDSPIQTFPKLCWHEFPYEVITYSPNVIVNLGFAKESPQNNILFTSEVTTRWNNSHLFFTDASKLTELGKTGVAVYYQNSRIALLFQCPPHSSVFTGECVGILEACLFIESHNISNAVIFSDSKSALESISINPIYNKLNSDIILNIRNSLFNSSSKGLNITLVWIPGHSGIRGNEVVDSLAKQATSQQVDNKHYRYQTYDILNLPQRQAHQSWQEDWDKTSKIKGRSYASIQALVPRKPWFSKYKKLNKKSVSILSRIRLGHCCTPVFLNKIRIRDSSLCECGFEEGSLDHIFFACPNNTFCIYNLLPKLNIPLPTNVSSLLNFYNNPELTFLLSKFININNIKL